MKPDASETFIWETRQVAGRAARPPIQAKTIFPIMNTVDGSSYGTAQKKARARNNRLESVPLPASTHCGAWLRRAHHMLPMRIDMGELPAAGSSVDAKKCAMSPTRFRIQDIPKSFRPASIRPSSFTTSHRTAWTLDSVMQHGVDVR